MARGYKASLVAKRLGRADFGEPDVGSIVVVSEASGRQGLPLAMNTTSS